MTDCDESVYLGIDPGLNITGYGVLRFSGGSIEIMDAGTIRSSPKQEFSDRLIELYNGIREVIAAHGPCAMGIEELYSHYKHPVTAIKMAHARGVLCLAAAQASVRTIPLPSTRIKKLVTGNGRAGKQQVSGMVKHLLGIETEIKPADVTDALAACIAAYESERYDRKYKRLSGGHS